MLGYDNMEWPPGQPSELTSFDQDVREMIRHSLPLILNEEAADEARRGIFQTVPARLIVRRTTDGAARAQPDSGEPIEGAVSGADAS